MPRWLPGMPGETDRTERIEEVTDVPAPESADSLFDISARNSQQETAIPDAYRSDRIFSDRTGEDLTFWLALRRVKRGGVA